MKAFHYVALSAMMLFASACAEGKSDTDAAKDTAKQALTESAQPAAKEAATSDTTKAAVKSTAENVATEAKPAEKKAAETVSEKAPEKATSAADATAPMIMLEQFVAGKHYQVLPREFPTEVDAGQIEVREYFLYTCPHCYQAEKKLQSWKKRIDDNVVFIPTPAIFRPNQELLARAYYVAKGLGVLDKTHMALFNRFHVEGKPVRNMDDLADFFKKHGVDKRTFEAANKSPIITNQLKQASASIRAYQVTGVPAFIVNGKYMTSATMAGGGGYAKVLQIIDHLIEKEQALLK